MFRSYDPDVDAADASEAPDVPDPFYGGPEGFDDVLAIVERTARRLVEELRLVT
jgi:protein-tyrosine phosphatase